MKATILVLIALGLCAPAWSTSLTTTDGATYNNISTQRVDPDGLYIEYALPGGGVGMSKVKFSRLSADQQKQFGFDATKAREYEAGVAKATEEYRQESLRMEQIAQAARHARAEQDDKAATDRMIALAQLNAAQANAGAAPQTVGGYDYYDGGGYGLYALPRVGGPVPPARRDYAPVVTPIPFPKVGLHRSTR